MSDPRKARIIVFDSFANVATDTMASSIVCGEFQSIGKILELSGNLTYAGISHAIELEGIEE